MDLAQPRYTHAYVSTIEAGRRTPSNDALEFFAQKLGVEFDELATGRPRGLTDELKLQVARAREEISRGNFGEAKSTAHKVVRKAREFDLVRIEAKAHEVAALAHERSGDLEGAIRRYEKAVDLLRREAPTAWAIAIAGQVRCLNDLGEPHHAVFVGDNYLDRLRRDRMASPSAMLRVQSSLVLAYLTAGSRKKAGEAAWECQRLIPKVNDPSALAIAYVNVGAAQIDQGHQADADISFAKAEELFEALELSNEAGVALLARGYNMARNGKTKEARTALQKASMVLSETGFKAQHANAEMELGRLDRLEGKDRSAVERLTHALELIGAGNQPRLEAWARRELGLALAKTDKARSEKEINQALELYELQDVPVEVARTRVLMAETRGAKDTRGQLQDYRLAAEAIHEIPEM